MEVGRELGDRDLKLGTELCWNWGWYCRDGLWIDELIRIGVGLGIRLGLGIKI
jgi:hypothetical protein